VLRYFFMAHPVYFQLYNWCLIPWVWSSYCGLGCDLQACFGRSQAIEATHTWPDFGASPDWQHLSIRNILSYLNCS